MNSFNVGDVVETTREVRVFGKGRIERIAAGSIGQVTFIDADSQHIAVEFDDIGKSIVNKDSVRTAQKPQPANDGGEAVSRPRLGDTLTPEAKNKRLLKFRDENAALQAENARLRSELEAARGMIEQLHHKINVIYDNLVFKDEVIE